MNSNIGRALKTNEWIHGTVSFVMTAPEKYSHVLKGVIKWTGIYVNRKFSRMENVQFTDPNSPNNTSDVENKLVLLDMAPDIQQQQQSLALINSTIKLGSEIGEQPLNYVSSNSQSQEQASSIDSFNVQGKQSFVLSIFHFSQFS